MSFILDALRRLEEKRVYERPGDILIPKTGTGPPKPGWRFPAAALALVALLALAVLFLLRAVGPDKEVAGEEGTVDLPPPAAEGRSFGGAGEATGLPEARLGKTADLPEGAANPPRAAPAAAVERPPTGGPTGSDTLRNQFIPIPPALREGRGSLRPGTAREAPPAPSEVESERRNVTEDAGASAPVKAGVPDPLSAGEAERLAAELDISGHVYSDDPTYRLISVNGRLRREGDLVMPGVKLEEITAEGAIFSSSGKRFPVKAF